MDASVVAPGDGLAKPVRFLEPARVGIGRTGAFLGGLVGRLDLRGHLPHYVGRVGWVLEGGQEHGQLILPPG